MEANKIKHYKVFKRRKTLFPSDSDYIALLLKTKV